MHSLSRIHENKLPASANDSIIIKKGIIEKI